MITLGHMASVSNKNSRCATKQSNVCELHLFQRFADLNLFGIVYPGKFS